MIRLTRTGNPGEYRYGKYLIQREEYYSTFRWSVVLLENTIEEVFNAVTLGEVREWLALEESEDV